MSPADQKRLATARATLALRGIGVVETIGPTGEAEFLVHAWQHTRVLADLQAVEMFVELVKGQHKPMAAPSSAEIPGNPGLSAVSVPATHVPTHGQGGAT